MNITDVKNDDVISFVYHGGELPGTVRRICVTENDGTMVKGFDIDKQGFRNYYISRMADVMINGNQPIDDFLLRFDAIKINQKLRRTYGSVDIGMIEDIISEYNCIKSTQ